MVRDPRFHRWRDLQRAVNLTEVVPREVERDRRAVVSILRTHPTTEDSELIDQNISPSQKLRTKVCRAGKSRAYLQWWARATRTPELYRVKVAFLNAPCFDAPKCLCAARIGPIWQAAKKTRRGECPAGRWADVRNLIDSISTLASDGLEGLHGVAGLLDRARHEPVH